MTLVALGVMQSAHSSPGGVHYHDEFSYLENSTDERTKLWVRNHNDKTLELLESDSRFKENETVALASEAEVDRPDGVGRIRGYTYSLNHGWLYQLSSSVTSPRGVLRRMRWQSFLAHRSSWQPLLDIDALAARESRNWIAIGFLFSPGGGRCLVWLSDGGSDHVQYREFDVDRRMFIVDGFNTGDVSFASVAWRNEDTLLISANPASADATKQHMPLVVQEWHRGRPLAEAKDVFRGDAGDLEVILSDEFTPGNREDHEQGNHLLQFYQRDLKGHFTYWQYDRDGRVERIGVNRRAKWTSFRRPTLTRVGRLFERSSVSDFI